LRQLLQLIRGSRLGTRTRVSRTKDLIQHHDVVCRPRSALQCSVRLKEKVPSFPLGDAAVDNGTGLGVAGTIHVSLRARVEPRVVPLSNNDDSHARQSLFLCVSWINLFTGSAKKRQLFVQDELVLALGDAVAIHQYVFGKRGILSLGVPKPQTRQ